MDVFPRLSLSVKRGKQVFLRFRKMHAFFIFKNFYLKIFFMSYSKLIMTMSTIKTMMIKINIIWQFIIETPDIQIYSFIFYG